MKRSLLEGSRGISRARRRGLNLLACCSVAFAFYACGDDGDDDGDAPGRGGSAGKSSVAGKSGSMDGGAGGSGGMPDAGGGGMPDAGGGGMPDAGSGGMPDAGGGGMPDAGGGGMPDAGGGGMPDAGGGGEAGSAGAGGFSCDNAPAMAACFEFGDPADDDDWTPEGGTWSVTDGAYVGTGPAAAPTCTGDDASPMVASLVPGFLASDLRMSVKMTGLQRADKVLVLRAEDASNRIEINFRADFTGGGGDVVVQESVDCESETALVGPGTIQHSHAATDTLAVDVELVGVHLKVWIDGAIKYDQDVPGLTTSGPGGAGFAVFADTEVPGITRFDELLLESLD